MNAVLRFIEAPSVTFVRQLAEGVKDAQQEAKRVFSKTAAKFAEQKPARNIEQERGYRAKLDTIHAQAVAILRDRGR